MFDEAKDAFGLEPEYPGGWYDLKGHTVHMPGHELNVGDADDRARDWMHEFLHATRRGNAILGLRALGYRHLGEGLNETQTLAAMTQRVAPFQSRADGSPYARIVSSAYRAVPDPLDVGRLLAAADSRDGSLGETIHELLPVEDWMAVLAKEPVTYRLARRVMLWLKAIPLADWQSAR